MIRARFIKAEPTVAGITYTLKGESDKVALHSAVDMQGEECIVSLAEEKEPLSPQVGMLSVGNVPNLGHIIVAIQDAVTEAYARGLQDATQGNLLTEERGEQK